MFRSLIRTGRKAVSVQKRVMSSKLINTFFFFRTQDEKKRILEKGFGQGLYLRLSPIALGIFQLSV